MGASLDVDDAVAGAERLTGSKDVVEGGGYLLIILGMLMESTMLVVGWVVPGS
jgi:hypothetical protein